MIRSIIGHKNMFISLYIDFKNIEGKEYILVDSVSQLQTLGLCGTNDPEIRT